MDCQKYWNEKQQFFLMLGKAIKDAWVRIVFSLIGKILPIFLGFSIVYFLPKDILNPGSTFENLFKPVTLVVYSATFFISAIFLWFKNLKRKEYFTLLAFFIFYMIITGLYVLSYIKDIHNKALYYNICKLICLISTLIYVFYEVRNSYYSVNEGFQKNRDNDFMKLKKNFNSKGN